MTPTAEEIQAVRVWECRMEGHLFDCILFWGSDDPEFVICTRCSKRWNIEREREETQ